MVWPLGRGEVIPGEITCAQERPSAPIGRCGYFKSCSEFEEALPSKEPRRGACMD